jgi:RimJ/RimL family protein N-acetyltransferase
MVKSFVPPLYQGQVRLRLAERGDADSLRRWRNRPEIRACFFNTEVVSTEQHLAWWERYAEAEGDWYFVIEEIDPELGPRPVGAIALYHYDATARSAEYGRLMVGEDWARGKGYARVASQLLLAYGFSQLELDEVHLEVLTSNTPARRLYESLGFCPVREASRSDALCLAVPRSAWPAADGRWVEDSAWRGLALPWRPARPPLPALSVVLAVGAGEEEEAGRLLRDLAARREEFEVLVVDDSGSDRVGRELTARADPRFLHLAFGESCPSRAARVNQGILLARGGVVALPTLTTGAEAWDGLLREATEGGADLVAWPEGSLLVRWSTLLGIGLADPAMPVGGCWRSDLRRRARAAGLHSVDRGGWTEPAVGEITRRYLEQDRAPRLTLEALHRCVL